MDKKQEKKIWNSQLAIENPKNDRIAEMCIRDSVYPRRLVLSGCGNYWRARQGSMV